MMDNKTRKELPDVFRTAMFSELGMTGRTVLLAVLAGLYVAVAASLKYQAGGAMVCALVSGACVLLLCVTAWRVMPCKKTVLLLMLALACGAAGLAHVGMMDVAPGRMSKVITPMSDNIAWKIETSGSNAYLINKAKGSDGYNQYIGFTAGGTTLSRKNSRSDDDKWTIDATHKSWLNSENQRSIIYNSTSNNFKNYVVGKIGTGSFATSYTQAYTFASGYTRTVTAGAWGTICLPNDVAADDYAGVKFYSIAGKDKAVDPTSITLQEVSELEAGVPYLFQVNEDATKLLAAYGKQSVATAGSNNGLIGSFAGTDVAEGMYLLSGGKIVLCGTGCSIAANRAYINMDEVPIVSAGVKGVTFFFNGQVGVNGLEADNQQKTAVYDLTGRSVNQTRQGLYIVNGKKVMVK